MKLSLKSAQPEKNLKACLVVGIYENGQMTPTAKHIDKISGGFVKKMIKKGAISGKAEAILPVYNLIGTKFEHILFIGCGKEKMSARAYRNAVKAAVKSLISSKVSQAVSYLSELTVDGKNEAWKAKHQAEVIGETTYTFDIFKSNEEKPLALKTVIINLSDSKQKKACETALKQGEAIANGVSLTKNLANLPSNICTPTFLAEQSQELAKAFSSIKTKVLNEPQMLKLGMGALLGVAQGSLEEAKLISIEYKGAAKSKAPVALVGKGITFDTGGNSIKPAEAMVGMKYDMCGAATVIGTIRAAAELKLPINIVGIIPAVENMPGGAAYKPEDILTSMSGKTIEVISTDAEGRLVLADALTYAERFKPETVIDIATLTGAVIIALSHHATGLVSNNDKLAKELLAAGEESHDRAWQLPLWEEFDEQLKSPYADMLNVGGRAGGTITAGCFLARFAEKYNWAHLDVAGTAAMMSGYTGRAATGRPVPMLMQYLINKAGK